MRNINKLSLKAYVILSIAVNFLALVIYRTTLFQCLFMRTYNESRAIFWIVCILSYIAMGLLTFKRRRNYLSVFSNAILPLAIYTDISYEADSFIMLSVRMAVLLLSGLYCLAVIARRVDTDDTYKWAMILINRLKKCLNASTIIVAFCFTFVFVSLLAARAFDVPSFIPDVKPSTEVAQDKSKFLEKNMPVISKIDDSVWKNLSFEDRLDVLQTLANVEASQQGLNHEINVCAENLGYGTYGTYDYSKHRVTINISVIEMDTATQSVTTLCHEVRHAYQHGITDAYLSLDDEYQQLLLFDEVRKYYENIEDYQTAMKDGFDKYESQIMEVDSREYSESKTPVYFYAAQKYLASSR